jgi:hypothetical protein
MGVSRSASKMDRSRAGAEKASLTPSNKPICNDVDDTLEHDLGTLKAETLPMKSAAITMSGDDMIL